MDLDFTKSAREAIRRAKLATIAFGHNYTGSEHLLVGLIRVEGVASKILEENLITDKKIIEIINRLVAPKKGRALSDERERDLTPRARHIIEQSFVIAGELHSRDVGTEHILLAILGERDCIAKRIINTLGVNVDKLVSDICSATGIDYDELSPVAIGPGSDDEDKNLMVDEFSRDLTKLAADGKLDPVVGREDEIERIIRILSRRTKNNPCLVGDPGVGKSAIVEGLAERIVQGNVPESMRDKRLLMLDLTGMVAGTKYRGEFEERIKKIISEVASKGNIILFLDELHTLIGAGSAEGTLDASNILKPSLARGEIQLIGATTAREYRKRIEKDPALERRFQPITVEEPSVEDSVLILKGLRSAYEKHHKVVITDEALEAAVKLSDRYINDRFLPDKAIDLIDEASSKVALGGFKISPKLLKITDKLAELDKAKEEAISKELYEEAASIKRKQNRLRHEKEELIVSNWLSDGENTLKVTENEIAEIVSSWTKVPVSKLQEEESAKLIKLEEELHKRVVGQDEAVLSVARAIRRGRVGLKDPGRPIGSFLFLGPTGVGKTELSKALAQALFGTEDSIIRVDMSEYMEKESVSKMIGSPPGYVGFEEGGQLSDKIRSHPYSVVLFDEIEKAHPDVFNVLLQVLDEGHITDSQGRKVSFKNAVIIMTSNAGAASIISPKTLGFATSADSEADYRRMKEGVMDEVKKVFKPEFINRIDEIICFHALSKEEVRKIVVIMGETISRRAHEELQIKLKLDDSFIDFIAEKGFDEKYGARPLKRAIQNELEDRLAEKILEGTVARGGSVKVYYDTNKKETIFKKR